MKRAVTAMLAMVSLALMIGCSNWNRATPAGMDDAAIKAEIKKNLAGDGMTGIGVDVNKGVVTLTGGVAADKHQTAVNDARKVNGVSNVVDNLNNQ